LRAAEDFVEASERHAGRIEQNPIVQRDLAVDVRGSTCCGSCRKLDRHGQRQFTSCSFNGAIFSLEFIRRSAHFVHLTFLFWEFPAMLLTVLLLAAVLALELRWIMR